MKKLVLFGWLLSGAGTLLWLYGYLYTGTKSVIDWAALTPWWIADYLPNREAEIGLLILCIGMIPLSLPNPQSSKI